MPYREENEVLKKLCKDVDINGDFIVGIDIYRLTKEVYDQSNLAMGRNVEYSIVDSTTESINISAYEPNSTTTATVFK